MKKSDLINIKRYYNEYKTLLFGNDLPNDSEVDFILHSYKEAAGYSAYYDKPTRSGNHHVIAFCRYFYFTDKQIQEILIHEMIHLWQVYHVKEDRYKLCSNEIAHDRVFRAKMNTINLILKKNVIDVQITEVCTYNLILDTRLNSDKDFKILFFEGKNNVVYMIKTRLEDYDACVKNYIEFNNKNKYFYKIYSVTSNSYLFSMMRPTKRVQNVMQRAEFNKENIFEKFKDKCELISQLDESQV